MPEDQQDANIAPESSSVAPTDAKAASSTVAPEATEASPALAAALKIAGVSETPEEPTSPVPEQDKTGEQPEASVEPEAPDAVKEGETVAVEEKLPPFHEHPRWKEMVSERDALKTQLEEHKPLIEAQKAVVDYCTEHGITQDQYGQALEFLRALNTGDISRAREIIRNPRYYW